jgi:alkyl hydroperoxide reductase subunit AhpC
MSLKDLSSKFDALTAGGVDVVVISADPVEATQQLVADNPELANLPFGCDLKEETMRKLGLYVSDPTHYIPQTYRFNEPGYYFLNPDSSIHYLDVATSPVGGRPNVDVLLMAKEYVAERIKTDPEFKKVVWGSA